MNFHLKGRVAAVAGASSGLGYAAALTLAQEGCKIGICSRSSERIENAAQTIRNKTDAEVIAITADVSQPIMAQEFIRNVAGYFGTLDIVVTNTGGPPSGSFAEISYEQWNRAVQEIMFSAVCMFQEALPIVQNSDQGRLIAVTSISAKQPLKNMVLSNATRAAIHGIIKTLSNEVSGSGTTVNAICPSAILTDRQTRFVQQVADRENISLEEAFKRRAMGVPLKRMGDPMEFAAAVAFLCSKQAGFITGVALPVDGGLLAGLP